MNDLGTEYEAEIISAVINAVISVRGDDSNHRGLIDPDVAFNAICNAIGIMAANFGGLELPSKQREFADQCRKQIFTAVKTAADPAAGLLWMDVQPYVAK